MWTKENRIRDNRDKRRYPCDLIEAEWPFIEPLIRQPSAAAINAG